MRLLTPTSPAREAAAGRPLKAEWVEQAAAVSVVATSDAATLFALKQAAAYAQFASSGLNLVVLHEVHFALPVDEPAVQLEWLHSHFRDLVSAAGIDASIHLCLCRNKFDAARQFFRAPGVVFLSGRKGWWPSRERRFIRLLEKLGQEVVLVPNGR